MVRRLRHGVVAATVLYVGYVEVLLAAGEARQRHIGLLLASLAGLVLFTALQARTLLGGGPFWLGCTAGAAALTMALGWGGPALELPVFAAFALGDVPRRWAGPAAGVLAAGTATAGALHGSAVAALGVGELTVLVAVAALAITSLERQIAVTDVEHSALAHAAAAVERQHLARDIHDLLGHSLTVVTLKSELASRLADSDIPALRRELAGLTSICRDSLRAVRDLASRRWHLRLDVEIEHVGKVLTDLGIGWHVRAVPTELADSPRELLAWAFREGATNMLRHSRPAVLDVAFHRADGDITMTMTNDGAGAPGLTDLAPGAGLEGLAGRLAAAGGRVDRRRLPGGRFELAVTVPLDAARTNRPAAPGPEPSSQPVGPESGVRPVSLPGVTA
ncbi:sensor histidine kinase [Frankia sp. Cr1]|uniref:sensor histidine kinase n=1 Tax=Frankia sp. Cr1 TaxID=3073931 RepID=UPI002AD54E04|nr:histidine kinase [Frankia sp. Cr1]